VDNKENLFLVLAALALSAFFFGGCGGASGGARDSSPGANASYKNSQDKPLVASGTRIRFNDGGLEPGLALMSQQVPKVWLQASDDAASENEVHSAPRRVELPPEAQKSIAEYWRIALETRNCTEINRPSASTDYLNCTKRLFSGLNALLGELQKIPVNDATLTRPISAEEANSIALFLARNADELAADAKKMKN
jgi:hypothetical protein